MSESMLSDIIAELARRDVVRADLIHDGQWASVRLLHLLESPMFDDLDDGDTAVFMRQVRLAARDVADTFARLEDIE